MKPLKTLPNIIAHVVILMLINTASWSKQPNHDDLPADMTTTKNVTVGSFETGIFEQAQDVDWMRVNLEAETTYNRRSHGCGK